MAQTLLRRAQIAKEKLAGRDQKTIDGRQSFWVVERALHKQTPVRRQLEIINRRHPIVEALIY
jgi:prenyltransferase beta subunit